MSECRFEDQYEEGMIIGTGTYGVVYSGVNRSTGALVAIKHVKNIDDGQGLPTTTMREISILKNLEHRNIVKLLDLSLEPSEGGSLEARLVFQRAEQDLAKYMNSEQPLPPKTIRSYMKQLLQGLDFMHRNGYIHRDIKPQNILVFNGGRTLKLADFGLCRRKLSAGNLTLEVGSLWYRAPEIMMGIADYSTSVDMWAIGCILYELYEGKPLFRNVCEIGCLFKIFEWTGSTINDVWSDLILDAPRYKTRYPKFKRPDKREFKRLPPTAENLLESLLQLNFKKRISAREALRHPYFTE